MDRALLFTDIVDSTRLTERLGHDGAAAMWQAHDRQAHALLARCGAREIERTDGYFLLFDRAADAAAFALGYHTALAEIGISARVGIHVGPVLFRENPPDAVERGAKRVEVEGIAKPLAARVMALAVGGQTLLTAAARDAIGADVPAGATVISHGHYRLKGIEEPVEILELGLRDGAAFVPPPDADKAYRVVRSANLWLPVREVRHNLPAERDAFVGRTRELRELAAHLDAGTRLVTVLGPGGMGKTRLVRRYGWSWLGNWPGGVYFCDLSDAQSLDGIHFAVGAALGVQLGREDPAVQLGNAIAGRGCCLVILDNFEQVTQHARATIGRWLDRAPDAAFVVTSRERLHLPGEQIFAVEPLDVARDAVELFATRARAHRPDFALNDSNRAAVNEVVRMLDGLPLAIELAAARVRIFSPAQLVERMRDRFALLVGVRGATARQATLRAAIDWSWDLLAPWEQDALAQSAIFDGGFTIEAAEAVLDLSKWPQAPPLMDVVQALVDKSLLRTWMPSGQSRYDLEEPCFGMYVTIREYATEKLARDESVAADVERRHGRYFAGFGTDDAIEQLSRHGGARRLRMLMIEIDNLVGACRRAVRRGDAETAVATYRAAWQVLEVSGPAALAVTLGAEVSGMTSLDALLSADARLVYGMALRRVGRSAESSAAFEESLAHFRASANRAKESIVLVQLGNLRRDQGRADESRSCLEAARTIAQETGNRRLLGHLLGNLAILDAEDLRLDRACALFEQAIAIHREVGNRRLEGIDVSNLGSACKDAGRLDDAKLHLDRALTIHREDGNRRDVGVTLANLGALHEMQGRHADARTTLGDAFALLREVGDRVLESFVAVDLASLLLEDGQADEALARCEHALIAARSIGNLRLEGAALAMRGGALAGQSQLAPAREALVASESLLREAGDLLRLAHVLCIRARVELADGNAVAADAAVAAAEEILQKTGVTHGETAADTAALRAQLNATMPMAAQSTAAALSARQQS